MYVCVCNAVTEEAVHTCLTSGAQTTREVKDGCGMKPGCGSCTKRIRAMLSEWKTANELMDAITGGPATLHAVPDEEGVELAPAIEPYAEPGRVTAEAELAAEPKPQPQLEPQLEPSRRPELSGDPAHQAERRFGRPVREVSNPAA
ncbi:bacterioferritin-associated ferredoxin [Actinocorallia sp. A-T 12471]|uniref:(2Fe-2S)-binding protein n=1 Tax=Actinocorallia sp. A-T 12471 TaxID=3089813 RepID=UPI0029D123BD|nr:(2Fe-2S)-binding protein [Actinocorallia sp. A-T 12471]MDX6745077.1 (2Fe-2S)-binding protein [Actinocorallia sp. A-T 12471]